MAISFKLLKVGVARFELATSWSQTRRDDRTTLHPDSIVFWDCKGNKKNLTPKFFL